LPLVPAPDCMGFGTRVYSAKLNMEPPVPRMADARAWHAMCIGGAPGVEVTGRILDNPSWCDADANGTVFGHWVVDWEEQECISSWGWGCTSEASGLRTYEATLYGRLGAGAWRDMCRRTPAIVHGTHFRGAMRCYHQEGVRVYGAWDLEDEGCA
ncbi:hypothetical protein HDZ31DRAFT_51465, partial [Schizophyllum fasciatum]